MVYDCNDKYSIELGHEELTVSHSASSHSSRERRERKQIKCPLGIRPGSGRCFRSMEDAMSPPGRASRQTIKIQPYYKKGRKDKKGLRTLPVGCTSGFRLGGIKSSLAFPDVGMHKRSFGVSRMRSKGSANRAYKDSRDGDSVSGWGTVEAADR
ncbi:hypothetical protein B0F90DRAFT_1327175 [Multifurca ochricompacta]|uniref:Uncharacterized protein n=1 Tax=Multifurca ochricompacta TaxID=376703 RepID=A0AAD4M835_9AGAM|nr:hypothetical protein B0F90DRAFT_1327175 [Multifurca ochricompacta]